jgi:conjugative relaxase-like TrwC/TraI family protein
LLPVAELRVGHEDYWLREVAESLCDYYAGRGEAKGVWLGRRALAGGFAGREAAAELVKAMFAGIDPATGERIAAPVWRADPRSKLDAAPLAHALKRLAQARGVRPEELARSAALRRDVRAVLRDDRVTAERADRLARLLGVDPREVFGAEVYAAADRYRGKRVDVRVAAFDLCFTHPKSISLLLAGGGDRVRAEGNAAREAALDQAITLLEREGLGVRRGHNGTERHQATDGLLAAKFTHRTSREGEPHWHDHVLVQNAVQGPDGRYTAIDSRRMYAWFMTVDHAYQACLRAELSRRLPGLRWRQVDERTGTAEIAGLDDPRLLRAFSSRSDQVAERKAEWAAAGLEVDGIRTSSKAARATRKAKPRGAADERTVYGRWEAELVGRGIDAQAMARVHGLDGRDRPAGRVQGQPRGYRPLAASQAQRLLDRVAETLTTQASTFSRREVLNELAKQLPPRPGTAADVLGELTGLADQFLGLERVVPVAHERGLDEQHYTTAEHLARERELLAVAERRIGEQAAPVVAAAAVAQAIAEHPSIGADQARLVRDLTRGDGVVCGVGPAGYGKTFAMKVLARACELGQVPVLGLAPTGEAAETLRAETGMDTDTVDGFLVRVTGRRPPQFRRGTVLVVDEASMVATRNLTPLLTWAERARVFVRAVGDHRQY